LNVYKDSTVTFATGSTKRHMIDPRRDISIISSINPDRFYGKTFTELGYNPSQIYWRKYLNDRTRTTPEDNTSGINFRIIRYADVLLMQAEALAQQNQTSAALSLVNQVRGRVNLAPLTGTFTRETMLQTIYMERAKEFAGEGVRWFDILRWGLMDNQAGIDELKSRDPDFTNFVLGKSKLLPIPRRDLGIDPNLKQNTGY